MDVLDRIGAAGLVPVVVIEDAEDAVSTAKALLAGGLGVMEITLRTTAGLLAIEKVRAACPEMLVGAGTVLSVEAAEAAADRGAQFIVAPGLNEALVGWCIERNLPVTPGCATPTEIERALSFGLRILKFFPAEVYGGIKGCKALYGPYKGAGVKFIPTGGVGLNNLAEFAAEPCIHAVGGSFLCKTADIQAGRFGEITEITRQAVEIVRKARA